MCTTENMPYDPSGKWVICFYWSRKMIDYDHETGTFCTTADAICADKYETKEAAVEDLRTYGHQMKRDNQRNLPNDWLVVAQLQPGIIPVPG